MDDIDLETTDLDAEQHEQLEKGFVFYFHFQSTFFFFFFP